MSKSGRVVVGNVSRIVGVVAPGQDAGVNAWVERFDPAAEHLG